MAEYQPTNNGVFGAQQAPVLPELEGMPNPYQGLKDQLFKHPPLEQPPIDLRNSPTPEVPAYKPDDGVRGYEKKTEDFWAQNEKRRHWELVREGMRRHPQNIENAYQWAKDRIDEINRPKDNADRYFVPKPYEGMI